MALFAKIQGSFCKPPEKLLGGGLQTPVPPFCLFCTIISKKTCSLDLYQNTPQVLAARSFLVAGFDTHVIPRSFSCEIRESFVEIQGTFAEIDTRLVCGDKGLFLWKMARVAERQGCFVEIQGSFAEIQVICEDAGLFLQRHIALFAKKQGSLARKKQVSFAEIDTRLVCGDTGLFWQRYRALVRLSRDIWQREA